MPTNAAGSPQPQAPQMADKRTPLRKLLDLLAEEQKDIAFINIYAVFTAIVSLALPLGIQGIVTRISAGLIFESVYVLIGLVVASTIISGVLQVMQIRLVEVLQRRIFARTAFNMTMSLLRLRFDSLRGSYLPELMNRFFDVITLQKSLPKLLIDLSAAIVQIIVGLMLLAFYHPFFVFLTLFLGFFVYILFRITGPEGIRTSIKESTYKYEAAYWLEELARVVRPARLFNQTETIKQTDHHVANYLHYRELHFKVLVNQYAWIVVYKVLVVGGLLILGVELVADAKISLGQFVASELIVVSLISAVEKIIMNMDTVYDLLAGTEKISHVTGLAPESETGSARLPARSELAGVHIDIRHMTCEDGSGRTVLRNYDAQIAPGRLHIMDVLDQETINVLIDILVSAHEGYTGVVLADGVPIRELDNHAWRQNVSLFTGATDLLAGTVESNLQLICPNGAYGELLLWLRRLGAEQAYLALPLGLETPILPAGRNLEGLLAEALPLAMRLMAHPRLLIVRDHVRFLTHTQKERIIEVLAAYAKQHTVIVFSGEALWHQTTQRVHELTTPTDANA